MLFLVYNEIIYFLRHDSDHRLHSHCSRLWPSSRFFPLSSEAIGPLGPGLQPTQLALRQSLGRGAQGREERNKAKRERRAAVKSTVRRERASERERERARARAARERRGHLALRLRAGVADLLPQPKGAQTSRPEAVLKKGGSTFGIQV